MLKRNAVILTSLVIVRTIVNFVQSKNRQLELKLFQSERFKMNKTQIEEVLGPSLRRRRCVEFDSSSHAIQCKQVKEALNAMSEQIPDHKIYIASHYYAQAANFATAIQRRFVLIDTTDSIHRIRGLRLENVVILEGTLFTDQDKIFRQEMFACLRDTRFWHIFDW